MIAEANLTLMYILIAIIRARIIFQSIFTFLCKKKNVWKWNIKKKKTKLN